MRVSGRVVCVCHLCVLCVVVPIVGVPLPWGPWQKHIFLGHPLGANMEQIRSFSGFSQFFVQCTKISFRRGGVCVYFLKSVRKGRFRNVWVKGPLSVPKGGGVCGVYSESP